MDILRHTSDNLPLLPMRTSQTLGTLPKFLDAPVTRARVAFIDCLHVPVPVSTYDMTARVIYADSPIVGK